jgi:hypothetical protein
MSKTYGLENGRLVELRDRLKAQAHYAILRIGSERFGGVGDGGKALSVLEMSLENTG